MNRKFDVRIEAEEDLRDAYRWYEWKRVGLGEEFLSCVEASLALIVRNPRMFKLVDYGLRKLTIRRFPYGIYYLLEDEHIFVVAVLHLKRSVGILKERL